MGRKTIGLLSAATLILAACGTDQGVVAPPDEPVEPVLRVEWEGGFVPLEWALGSGPSYELLSDGTLIFAGVTTMQYPGPLVVPYQSVQLTDQQVQQVIAQIEAIGLPGMLEEADDTQMNHVADASTYVVTYYDEEGEQHRYSVYALGIEPGSGSEATQETAELDTLLVELSGSGQPTEYAADQMIVFAGQPAAEPEPGFEDVRPWPLPEGPEGWSGFSGIDWKCNVYPGDNLGQFSDATQVTQWTAPDDSGPYTLVVRQLLPGEDGCPDLDSEL